MKADSKPLSVEITEETCAAEAKEPPSKVADVGHDPADRPHKIGQKNWLCSIHACKVHVFLPLGFTSRTNK